MKMTRLFTRSCVALVAMLLVASVVHADPPNSKENEQSLLARLKSDAPASDKALVCKFLAVQGSEASVPELAKLLTDEQLASWARIALEAIPGPASDEALRKAIPSLKGRLLVGTINSIGVRADAGAVDPLSEKLKDQDAEVASAAAVALGHIANDAATKSLRQSLAGASDKTMSAVAEGCILCAERLLKDGKGDEAAAIYDEVRKSNVSKQKKLEATRGSILARKTDGIPLLVEQLRSPDKVFFQLGLGVAREVPGREVAQALVAELAGAAPERGALMLVAIADRHDVAVLPAVLDTIRSGSKQVRIAAIEILPRLGDESCVATLLEIATADDAELASAAKTAIAGLPGERIDADIKGRLTSAQGKSLPVLLAVVGMRRIDAVPEVMKSLSNPQPAVRGAALAALGETVSLNDLGVLVSEVVTPKFPSDAAAAQLALRTACVRMPDREKCAEQLAVAMSNAPVATKCNMLEILGAVGGQKSLATLGAAAKNSDPQLQDYASRALGEWMNLDAAPVLLDLSKSAPEEKYQIRALRGYIRLARQFATNDTERLAMCQKAMAASDRATEQKLVLEILGRVPTIDALKVTVKATEVPALKEDATKASMAIAQKIGKSPEAKELIGKVKLDPVKLEIVKAEYGVGTTQKDVTETLRKMAGTVALVNLPSTYPATFGDPLPGTKKELKVQYRINGKDGTATFPDNSVLLLPMPK